VVLQGIGLGMASPWGRTRSNMMRHFNAGDRVRVKNECQGSASMVAFVWPGDAIPAPKYPMYRIGIAPESEE